MKKLKIGDRVIWSDEGALGTVVETGYCAVKVKWDDGLHTIMHAESIHEIEKHNGAVAPTALKSNEALSSGEDASHE